MLIKSTTHNTAIIFIYRIKYTGYNFNRNLQERAFPFFFFLILAVWKRQTGCHHHSSISLTLFKELLQREDRFYLKPSNTICGYVPKRRRLFACTCMSVVPLLCCCFWYFGALYAFMYLLLLVRLLLLLL